MSRKKINVPKRGQKDPRYGSEKVDKFICRMMRDGKKSTSSQCVYGAFDVVAEKTKKDPFEVFVAALDNVKPSVEVKSRRVGGSTYQVPVEIRESRRETLAMRWIIKAARDRNGRTMSEKLSAELMDALNKTGSAFKKKEDTHRMAEANKAFSHYRW